MIVMWTCIMNVVIGASFGRSGGRSGVKEGNSSRFPALHERNVYNGTNLRSIYVRLQ